ncbi:MAG: T9SS type A sorting domain-containing protein, partial [Melioribacteraceae bacterium]|nr:T9SS type A sorting domain-containing protein [Melioribacteraceae bacterium]MCF8263881.1 T9SS type A sorting domain-containing protein [Melioribacteraceae bacterium]MCF8430286.1 T9SS type A sorting domain-containing protein [Melioribacteraceae bacterium]
AEVGSFKLGNPYPNPFNPTTNIQFKIPQTSNVTISVYNSLGEAVELLHSGTTHTGVHNIYWNASFYSSGNYFIQMRTENYSETKKVCLVK